MVPYVIATLLIMLSKSSSPPSLSSSSKPHILFLVVDDLGWTDISAHGAEYETANIDKLLSTGVELTNYHVHLDCSPTRSALMTGQYSFKNGLQSIRTIQAGTTQHIPFENPTLPELLRKADYSTHMLGKWHLGYAAWNMTPTGRGFDSHYGYLQGAEDYYTHEAQGNGFDFFRNRKVDRNGTGTYSTTLYHQYMTELLEVYNASTEAKPLFVYMAFQTIHAPIQSPPQNYSACDGILNPNRRIYCNKMQFLDGVILDYVNLFEDYHLWDDTLLIFSTDNGGMPYWNNNYNALVTAWGCNVPYRAGKATLFEGGVKGVGFINGGQNVFPAQLRGTSNGILSHVIDWLPTILGGVLKETLPVDVPFDGLSMWDALLHPDDDSLWNRTTLFIDIEQNGAFAGVIDGEWKYFEGQPLYTAYYPCNSTDVPDIEQETEWLFNLKTDPYEAINVAKSNPQLVENYKAMIQQFIADGGYVPEQDNTVYAQAMPAFHDGVWLPWLG